MPSSTSFLSFTIEGIPQYHHLCQQIRFTQRELEIIGRLSYGKNAEEIAEELMLSISTVNKYLSNIRHKVNAKDTNHLLCIVFRGGIVC